MDQSNPLDLLAAVLPHHRRSGSNAFKAAFTNEAVHLH
jgi:hypothetical protein